MDVPQMPTTFVLDHSFLHGKNLRYWHNKENKKRFRLGHTNDALNHCHFIYVLPAEIAHANAINLNIMVFIGFLVV